MKVSVLLMATIVLLGMAVDGKNDGGCIRRVGEIETPVPGSCLCYDKCARKEGDQAGLTNAQAQTCFVECMLRDGGWVFRPDGGGEAAAAVAPQPPRLDVVLSRHVRVAVTRPKVSRSREEKEETEEVLVVEMGFGSPGVRRISFLDVWLNTREGQEKVLRRNARDEPRYAGYYVVHEEDVPAGQDKAARKFPIGGNLEAIGADGDKTVMVSVAPNVLSGKKGPHWFERQTFFVRGAYIVYEPKEHVTHRDGTGLNDQLVTRWN